MMNKGRMVAGYLQFPKANLEINKNSSEILIIYSELFSMSFFENTLYAILSSMYAGKARSAGAFCR